MNTIKDLAKKMWDNLPFNSYNTEISKTHYCLRNYRHIDYQLLTDEEIENIFYNEVVVKWFQTHSLYHLCNGMQKETIIAAYLKEHTKEQPKGLDLVKLEKQLDDTLENETTESLTTWLNKKQETQSVDNSIEFNKWLKDKKQRYLENKEECYNDILSSTTSAIDQFLKSPYQAQKGVLESAVKCNEMFLEFVDNTIDVEEKNKSDKEIIDIALSKFKDFGKVEEYPVGTVVRDMYNLAEDEFDKPCYTKLKDGKWSLGSQKYFTIDANSIGENKRFKLISIPSQPKAIEDNVWDEAQSNYFNSENCDNDVYQLLSFLKQHYSLIKK